MLNDAKPGETWWEAVTNRISLLNHDASKLLPLISEQENVVKCMFLSMLMLLTPMLTFDLIL